MRPFQRIVAGIAAAILVAGVGVAGVRAGGRGAGSDHDLLVSANARLASFGTFGSDLAAVRARTDALRRAVSALQPDPAAARGTITVIGEGRASGAPDMMSATIGVSVRRATVQEALAAAGTAARRVVSALKSGGVRARDIRTEWVSLDSSTDSRGHPNGYRVENHVRATIRDLGKAGRILGAAAEAGGNAARLSGVSFGVEDSTSLARAARRAAMGAANGKAQEYARAAGRRVGAVLSISESSGPVYPSYGVPFAAPAMVGGSSIPIEPGREQMSVAVTVVFALE